MVSCLLAWGGNAVVHSGVTQDKCFSFLLCSIDVCVQGCRYTVWHHRIAMAVFSCELKNGYLWCSASHGQQHASHRSVPVQSVWAVELGSTQEALLPSSSCVTFFLPLSLSCPAGLDVLLAQRMIPGEGMVALVADRAGDCPPSARTLTCPGYRLLCV